MSELRNGDLTVGLVPEIGGSVAYFRKGTADLMRPLSDADRARGDVLGVGMFPMVPFANRIDQNQFSFEGRVYHFAQNNPPERFHVHGTGWHRPWTEHRMGDDEAELELVHIAPDEPYSYAARQHFKLSPEALTVTTELENRGERRMPFGFGQHPWFPPEADATASFDARSIWVLGRDGVPVERHSTPPESDFTSPRTLPRDVYAYCYGDWTGRYSITWPSRGIGLAVVADEIFKHLMVYSDPKRPALCLEPQTNAVSAFTLADGDSGDDDLGIIVLDPGEKASGTMTFKPFVP